LSRRERKQIERQLQAKDPGWEIVHHKVAGIDVGNERHFVAVDARKVDLPVREFGSWKAGLHQIVDWLKTCQVQRVVTVDGIPFDEKRGLLPKALRSGVPESSAHLVHAFRCRRHENACGKRACRNMQTWNRLFNGPADRDLPWPFAARATVEKGKSHLLLARLSIVMWEETS
jgi:hypothetical protein